jgi:disulfide bond formation protein DsbB
MTLAVSPRSSTTLPPRFLPALAGLGSALMLAYALFSEHVQGYWPCALCLEQRKAHLVALALAFVSTLLWKRRGWALALLGLTVLAYLGSAGLAGYHVGVEQGWWQGLPGCTGPSVGSGLNVSELKSLLLATPVVRCDEVQWALLGISMAGWNVVGSVVLAAVAALGLRARRAAD